ASSTGKPRGGDLREGKITPPLRLCLDSLPEKERTAFSIGFRNNSLGTEELNLLTEAVFSRGFARRARSLADVHLDRARTALNLFPAGEGRDLLSEAVEFVRNREH
ncbi:MAG: polyprenyl synthetase family protein, partial [Deltaproteobacteria bacterium]|nr:polyprenyl synthetase family protein [Deltaproteobacteria bacterium]